ncbi:hypothetical protein [Pseudonocardia endophytica]|uniref:Uncharacterized protein n=1 Tax=Pseudonocardia endophytica TaxID=401976 RepID=A0A4R1HXE6_PSEEN|nr:hypothetical protein [Pseudonocardia endophytica]TCK25490.1 hypothetical protein EV378_1299 [Pseudonocardia endophytica]
MTRRRSRRPADRRAHGQFPGYGHGHGHGYGGVAVRDAYRMERRDRRRERRMRRRHGRRGGPPALLFVLGALVGLVFLGAIAVRVAIGIVEGLFPLIVIGLVGWMMFRLVRRARRAAPAPDVPQQGRPATGEQVWNRAKAEFDRVRAEYTAHECDPMAVLRRPALSDVSVASTARFVDAFAEAQALDTETYPGSPHDAGFVAAAEHASRAWQAAQDAADRIRLSGLPPAERSSVERVLKLLTTARDSDSEPERLAAYARARSELDRLDRAGIVHLPRTARAAIDENSRRALPG